MNNNNHPSSHNTYRPRSPDLSGFAPPPPPKLGRLPSYSQHPDPSFPQGYSFSPRGSYDASPYFSPQTSQAPSYFANQPHQQPVQSPQEFLTHQHPYQTYHPQAGPSGQYSTQQPALSNSTFQSSTHGVDNMPRKGASSAVAAPAPPTALPIDVKTKFPVARIKRIMQADEDVGKVSQATPTAVAKALELYMIDLVKKGASAAKSQNSKRVTATHLKSALISDEKFDFLKEICEACPDEGTKKNRGKSEARSDDSDEDIQSRRKSKAGGKRKKDEDSD